MSDNQNRRKAIKNILVGSAALGSSSMLTSFKDREDLPEAQLKLKGNINHSVCAWCYGKMTIEELCLGVKKIGFLSRQQLSGQQSLNSIHINMPFEQVGQHLIRILITERYRLKWHFFLFVEK